MVVEDRDDKAAMAIAPMVLGLNEAGKAELKRVGLEKYCSYVELQKLYSIVAAVERVFIENPEPPTSASQ